MGDVQRVRDKRLGREVALKRILKDKATPRLIQRFLNEAKALAKFNHPGIVRVYDYGEDALGGFITMELIEGGDLQDKIDTEGSLSSEVVLDITEHIWMLLPKLTRMELSTETLSR